MKTLTYLLVKIRKFDESVNEKYTQLIRNLQKPQTASKAKLGHRGGSSL